MSIHEKINSVHVKETAATKEKETAANKQVVALDSKWLKKLKDFTHANYHTQVLVELARYLLSLNPKNKSYKTMASQAEKFMDSSEKLGYVTMEQSAGRYQLLKRIEAALAKHLNTAQIKQLRQCY